MRGAQKPQPQQSCLGGLLLNKQQLRRAREIAQQYPQVEFLYLRENRFDDFDPYIPLEYLKTLDLSLNSLHDCSFLWGGSSGSGELPQMPLLRHLYLTGNHISSLSRFSGMGNLETLALSGNNISSFEDFGSLPCLRVLSLGCNSIETFKHFPFFPRLHSLNLDGNPLDPDKAKHPEAHALFRRMAVAVCGPELAKVDGVAVTREEQQDSWGWGGKVLFAFTEGFVPEAVREPTSPRAFEPVSESGGDTQQRTHPSPRRQGLRLVDGDAGIREEADTFLFRHQVDPDFVHCSKGLADSSRPLRLLAVALSSGGSSGPGPPKEGEAVTLNVCLQDTRGPEQRESERGFYSPYIRPVQFRVEGMTEESREAFLVGSMNGWAGRIALERVPTPFGAKPIFDTMLYLPPGEYEYRYIIDGVDTCQCLVVGGGVRKTTSQGVCTTRQVAAEPDLDDDAPDDVSKGNIIHVRWLRSNEWNGFDTVDGVSGLALPPAREEVGRYLRAEVLCYLNGAFDSLFFDISEAVAPAAPSVRHIALHGTAAEGEALELVVEYFGGEEGPSEVRWLRVRGDVELDVTRFAEEVFSYPLSAADVGANIKVEYTPMREDAPDVDEYGYEMPCTTKGPMAHVSSARIAARMEEAAT